MSLTDQFSLALQAYREVAAELGQQPCEVPVPPPPGLDQLIQEMGELPEDSLLLGVASDGLPVLLDLYDPTPGPILVMGDGGSGKTAFLQVLAGAVDRMPGPGEVQFGVITNFPDEWTRVEGLPGDMGIWPAYHDSSSCFLRRLVAWGDHPQNDGRTAVLLLMDDLEALLKADLSTRQDLRWLLTYGPERRIWPVATLNAGHVTRNASWLQHFSRLIFGYTRQPHLAETLTGDSQMDLSALYRGVQFSLRKPDGWLRFWIPSIMPERSEV